MSLVSFPSDLLFPLPLPRLLGQVATDWVQPFIDTGRRLEGRRRGETKIFLLLPFCLGWLPWGSGSHWTDPPCVYPLVK